jgi:hypothetical protein
VTTLDTAQKTRFININMKFDIDVWAQWAEKDKLDTRAINFLLFNPELITERYNARAFVTFFNAIATIEDFEKNLPMIQMLGEGAIGPEASTLFTAFINNKLDKIVSPKDLITHTNESYVIGLLNDSVNVAGNFRADISSVIATRVINFCSALADSNKVDQAVINRLIKLTTDCDGFNDDLKYYIIKELIGNHKVKFAKLLNNIQVAKMAMK